MSTHYNTFGVRRFSPEPIPTWEDTAWETTVQPTVRPISRTRKSWCSRLVRAAFWAILVALAGNQLRICEAPSKDQVTAMIEAQLLKFAKDNIALRDFAHPLTGGQIIHALTSPTFVPEGLPDGYTGVEPEVAITAGIQPGNCWPFAGSHGHIGVYLSEPVTITNVTIDHIAAELAPDARLAPRDMTLWGLADALPQGTLATELLPHESTSIDHAFPIAQVALSSFLTIYPRPVGKFHDPTFIPLASFTYRITEPAFFQTFQIGDEYKPFMPMRVVVLEIKNNWGHPLKTCLYRVRVHGDTK